MSRALLTFTTLTAVLGCAGFASAQGDLDLEAMAREVRRNQEELQNYTWRSTVTYLVDGEQRRQDVYTVRYDDRGRLEKMQVSSDVAKGKLRGADGRRLSKDEREAAREFALEVRNQLFGYLSPLFAEQAVLHSEVESAGDEIHLESQDIMTNADTVRIVLDAATLRPRSAEISSRIGESPITLEIQFDHADYGPSYPVHSVTRSTWQGLELTIITDDSEHAGS